MSRLGPVLGLLILAACAACWGDNAPPRISVEQFFGAPAFESPAFSPSGKRSAVVTNTAEADLLLVYDPNANLLVPITELPTNYILKWVVWASDERLLFSVEFKHPLSVGVRARGTHLYAVNADGSDARRLGENWKRNALIQFQDQIISFLPDDPEHVLIAIRMDYEVSAYRLNIYTGRISRVVKAERGISEWMADHTGAIRLGMGVDSKGILRIISRMNAGSKWTTLYEEKDSDSGRMIPIGFDFDGRSLFVRSDVESDRAQIYRYDLIDAKFGEVVFAHPEVDAGFSMMVSENRKKVLAFDYTTDEPAWHFVDEEAAAEWRQILTSVPGRQVRIVSKTRDENWLILEVSDDTFAPTYFFYDRSKGSASRMYTKYPALSPETLAPMRPISYEARDGLKIHGFLTLPLGREARNLPTVIYPHGGPTARDVRGYDPAVQFLANRGYAVLQMNFRGSTGYGRSHVMAGWEQYGLAMQDDITDGVHWLLSQGIADPKRICIFGASYGGYAAMMGLVKTPELYSCGASYAGISDLEKLIRTDEYYRDMDLPLFPDEASTTLRRQVSPVNFVENIRAPLLLAHGEDDPRVSFDQSRKMSKALKKAGKPHELYIYTDEVHGFSRDRHAIEFYSTLERFLDRNLATPRSN